MYQGLDLFGQVAVTWPEIFDWVESVAGIPAGSPRAAYYARAWDVAGKVAAAKLQGTHHEQETPTGSHPAVAPHG